MSNALMRSAIFCAEILKFSFGKGFIQVKKNFPRPLTFM